MNENEKVERFYTVLNAHGYPIGMAEATSEREAVQVWNQKNPDSAQGAATNAHIAERTPKQ